VHLAAAIRDQRAGSIEELNGIATWRMVQAAERAGVEHFVFFSSLGASSHDRTRVLRAKALAERAVLASDVRHTVFAPSIVYAPGDRLLTFLERLALLSPVMPLSGRGEARYQPIWAEDVADCVMNLLGGATGTTDGHGRFELAGPQTLSHREIVDLVLRAARRPRRMVSVPSPLVCRTLRAAEMLLKSRAPATWDEAELLEVSMTSQTGTDDAQRLGVTPRSMAAVLGVPTTAAPARAAPRARAGVPRRQAGR
jgi:NADH dehydrogenase